MILFLFQVYKWTCEDFGNSEVEARHDFVAFLPSFMLFLSLRWTWPAAQIYISKITVRGATAQTHMVRTHKTKSCGPKYTPGLCWCPLTQQLLLFDPPGSSNPTRSLVGERCTCAALCALCTLLEPGSIWLTPAVCFKGWGVFWIWSPPPNRVQAGVSRWKALRGEGLIAKTAPPCCWSLFFVILAKVVEKVKKRWSWFINLAVVRALDLYTNVRKAQLTGGLLPQGGSVSSLGLAFLWQQRRSEVSCVCYHCVLISKWHLLCV